MSINTDIIELLIRICIPERLTYRYVVLLDAIISQDCLTAKLSKVKIMARLLNMRR